MTTISTEMQLGDVDLMAAQLAALGHGSVELRKCDHKLHLAVVCLDCAATQVDHRRWVFDLDLRDAGVNLGALRMTVDDNELPEVVETLLKGSTR